MWYDEMDEREERRKELRRHYPGMGHAHLMNAPQSMKKMNRIIKLVSMLGCQSSVCIRKYFHVWHAYCLHAWHQ